MKFAKQHQAFRLPILLMAAGAALLGDTINFDNLATGVGVGGSIALGTQYQSQGVIFGNIEASKAFTFNIMPDSAPNYASPFFGNTNPGFFEFVDPSSSAAAYVTSLSFTLLALTNTTAHPGFFSGGTIEGLDLLGNVIAGDTFVIPAATISDSDVLLTFTGQVHEVLFTHTDGTAGLLPFDDLNFGTLVTPEPSGVLLAGTAVLLVAGLRRAKRVGV